MHAVVCLPAVTGAWQHKGGGALYGHTGIYPLDRSLIEGLDVVDRSVRELDQSRLGPILTGDAEALKGGPPVTALLVQNTNPAMVCPELHKVHAGLAREDLFTCVHEQFMTETAAFADVVLPATSFLEHDDFYTASGHTTFQVTRKLIEAARRGAREPLRDLRAGQAARRPASRLRHERLGDHGRDAAPLGHVGCADQLRARRPGLRLSVRADALPRRVRHRRTASSTSAPTGNASAAAGRRCRCCPTIST